MPASNQSSEDHTYDFFLSFSGADEELARRAKEQLTQLGYRVCYQDEDFKLGHSFLGSMNEGHLQSKKVVALFTPRYLATSPYTALEFEAALVGQKLLIFRFQGAAIPPAATTQSRQEFPDELLSPESFSLLQKAAMLQPTRAAARSQRVHLEALPHWKGQEESPSKQVLIGRDRELRELDKALGSKATKIVCVIADGGFGKSALVNRWLMEQEIRDYSNVKAVYGYSFYKQAFKEGSDMPVRPFFEDLLLKLTDFTVRQLDTFKDDELAREALRYLRTNRVLLILDGLEPNQYSRHTAQAGDIQQPLLEGFLKDVGKLTGEGLCVITSRLMPRSLVGPGTIEIQLKALDHPSSVAAFVAAGLSADCPELETWATKSGGLPLLIALLAPAIESGHYDPEMFRLDQVLTEHDTRDFPKTVQNVVATRLAQLGKPAQAVMYCMALYGHAVAYQDLRREIFDRKVFPLFTEPLYNPKHNKRASSEMLFLEGVDALTKAAMVSAIGHPQRTADWILEAHPLVQAGVRCHLQENHQSLWKLANWTVYKSKSEAVDISQPEETADLRKLYAAVPHGVEAGEGLKAGWMYAKRCLRGFRAYSTNRGMVAEDVALISNFFQGNWRNVREDIRLNTFAVIQANVWAGVLLTAINRAHEGIPRMRDGLEMAREARSFTTAARTARFLGVLLGMRGNLKDGELLLRESLADLDRWSAFSSLVIDLKFVDRNFQRMASHTMLASLLHEQKRFQEAEVSFRNAEAVQRKATKFRGLRNIWCYRKVDFLYDMERFEEARAELEAASVEPEEPEGWGEGVFVEVILQLARLRGAVREADILGNTPDATVLNEGELALKRLDRDQGFRMDWLQPVARIAVAGKARLTGAFPRAGFLLDEAKMLIDKSGNVLFEVDLHMERARLHLAAGEPGLATKKVEQAEQLANRIGYLCRTTEMTKLRALCDS
jgi:tetratricopeptide (TPR) repeat protein